MGIRFTCPNGHKLNVKEHLAGKVGFCPECGVRLVIPFHSTRKSSKGHHDENPAGAFAETPAAVPAETPAGFAAPAEPDFGISSSFFEDDRPKNPAPVPENPLDPTMNPILRDQTVVWYIQVPDGPQYGPASGQVVHSWILQRRISANMLVWREGWANWLEAKNVFPELE